jgi:hypothetical protein
VLAGRRCVDGTGFVDGCAPSNYCLPHSVYEQCLAFGGFSCAEDITAHQINEPTRVVCYIHNDGMGKLCQDPIPGVFSQDIFGHLCKQGSARIIHPGAGWSDTTTLTASDGSTIDIKLDTPADDCEFTITPSGSLMSSTPTGYEVGALIAGDLDNGRGIAAPYIFVIDSTRVGCGNVEPCQLLFGNGTSNDATAECIESPVVP